MVKLDATLRIYLQYYEKEINLTRIAKKAYQEGCDKTSEPVEDLEVYVKPEDGKAYYVVNRTIQSYIDLWDFGDEICNSSELSGGVLWYNGVKHRLIFEYRGRQCDCDSIISRILDKLNYIYTSMSALQEIEIYVRQEHETAFYVVNGRHTGSVAMFA